MTNVRVRRKPAEHADPAARAAVYMLEDQVGFLLRCAHQRATEIFNAVSSDKPAAARKVLGYLSRTGNAKALLHAANRLIFLKGNDSHDYKFSAAVLEDFNHLSPMWRERNLAASVFWLNGSGAPDNKLVERARRELAG